MTELSTTIRATDRMSSVSHAEQHNEIARRLALIAESGVSSIVYNITDEAFGAVGDGGTENLTAIQLAIDTAAAADGGVVYAPPGHFMVSGTLEVPSRVIIRGAGNGATVFFSSASPTSVPMFETVSDGEENEFGQMYGQGFEDFLIEDRASANTSLTPSGRSEAHHGIKIHDSDNGFVRNVGIHDLKGRGLWFSNVAREWYITNTQVFNCADGTTPAVEIGATSGDATNTLSFVGCRFVFNQGVTVDIDGDIDGVRLIAFTNCQFEGGGADDGVDYIDPAPYDLVILSYCQTVTFTSCNFSNPGENEHCINVNGSASSNIDRVDVIGCRFNANTIGGCIRASRQDTMAVTATLFEGSTVEEADIYIEANSGLIFIDHATMFSSNPFAGAAAATYVRGKISANDLSFTDWDISLPNGLFKAALQGGANAYTGSSAENTVFDYTIAAGAMGTLGGIRGRIGGYFNFNAGATTAVVRLKIAGTTVWTGTTASLTIADPGAPWNMEFDWRNTGTTNSNSLQGWFTVGTAALGGNSRGDFGTMLAEAHFSGETTTDTTAAVQIVVTIQLGAARDNVLRTNYAQLL